MALQNLSNQQSIVRTDFTLKYYQVDELLKAHQKLKINGAQSQEFMRSWFDFSLVRGDTIIPWLAGDFKAFLKMFSHVFKQSVEDSKALTACLNSRKKPEKVIITININAVAAAQISLLLDAITPKDLQQVPLLEESADVSCANEKLANIVIWSPQGEHALTSYDSILAVFSATLDVGGVKAPVVTAAASRKLPIGIAVVLTIGLVGFYWHYNQDAEIQENVVSTPESVSIENQAVAVPVIEQATKDSIADDGESEVESEEIKSETLSMDENTHTEQDSQLSTPPNVMLKPAIAGTDLESENSSQLTDVASGTDEKPAQSNAANESGTVIADKAISRVSGEKVKIVAASTVPVINVGSSIKTHQQASASDLADEANKPLSQNRQVDLVVAAWVDAWQQQKFDDYSRHYIDTFSAKKSLTHAQWLDWRRKRIEKPSWIKLSFSNIKHLENTEPDVHSITFTLIYSSPNYKDKTFKRLSFKQVNNAFKIISEENLQVTKI